MNVLIVTQYFWPENFRINEVALELKKAGHLVEVLTGQPNYPEGSFHKGYGSLKIKKEVWQDIPVYRLPIVARGRNNKAKLTLNYLSFILSGLFLGPLLLRKRSYDVILSFGLSPVFQVIPASFIGWIKKVPVVLWIQDLWPQSASATGHIQSEWIINLLKKAVAFSYRHTDMLLAQSKAFFPHISELNSSQISVRYLPNFVDDSFLTPNMEAFIDPEAFKPGFNIVFAGNIGAAQSVETILNAAEKLKSAPQIRFIIFGQGSKLDWLKTQIELKKLENIVLAGYRPIDEMPAILSQASALLVTLAKQPIFALTIPSKIQAYLASGRPIIASLDGEGAKIIHEASAGITVPAEDADALSNAILMLSKLSQTELDLMGENAQIFFKMHFTQGRVMRVLESYLEEAVDNYKGQ